MTKLIARPTGTGSTVHRSVVKQPKELNLLERGWHVRLGRHLKRVCHDLKTQHKVKPVKKQKHTHLRVKCSGKTSVLVFSLKASEQQEGQLLLCRHIPELMQIYETRLTYSESHSP